MTAAKKKDDTHSSVKKRWAKFVKSIWLYPCILTLLLVLLTVLKINGSSVGVYQNYFYNTKVDSHLIAFHPKSIRSDEFLNNTQMSIAQSRDNFAQVNKNLGDGENMSLIEDAPYASWSEAFKPHNLAFFVLPFDYAFAFKWWIMAYLLLISCYFFVLSLLPGKRLLAAGISISILFSAFVQWWYQYITLGPLYYSFFIATVFVHFLRQTRIRNKVILAALIAYLLSCFILVFYPPFQIACAIALSGFIIGELIVYYRKSGLNSFLKTLAWLAASILISGIVAAIYFTTNSGAVKAINDTVYPGHRVVASGGFNIEHFLSGNLGRQFISVKKTADYRLFNAPTNQSEASNFLLLLPFLFIPALYLLFIDKRKNKKTDWPLLLSCAVFVLFLLELFVPQFTTVSKLFFFQRIPLQRDLIGVGLLNIIVLILFIKNYYKKVKISNKLVIPYTFLVLCIEVYLGLYARSHYPGFITLHRAILFAIPVPIIIYLLLRKYFSWAIIGLVAFSLFVTYKIMPLYQGLAVLESNPISISVQQIVKQDPHARWVTGGLLLENFALINGAPSLSGLYYYPQTNIWKNIEPGNQSYIYNRYANVNFQFIDSGNPNFTQLQLLGGDDYLVNTSVCSSLLKNNNVRYILTTQILKSSCVKVIRTISLPGGTFYIYKDSY